MEEGEVIMVAIRRIRDVYAVDTVDGVEVRRDSLLGAVFVAIAELEAVAREQMPDSELMEGVVH